MAFPVLEFAGGRVLPFEVHHLTPRYVAWLNDRERMRFSEQRHRTHTLESCRAYFESFRGSADHFLAIESLDAELGHVGNISIAVDGANRVADLSIMVGEPRAAGTGLATGAWRAVLDELLLRRGMRKVTAGTMAANEPMLRLMRRSGMSVEGRRVGHFLYQGQPVDLVMAAKFAPEKSAGAGNLET